MKKQTLITIVNFILGAYLVVWVYYAAFNWDVFSIKLNTNAGFSVIGGYPFAFFFLFGFAALLALKYVLHLNKVYEDKKEKDSAHRIAMQEKDIELLKMKEVLFKMQTSEMSKNSSHLDALHEKLDSLSQQMEAENNTSRSDEDTPGETNKEQK